MPCWSPGEETPWGVPGWGDPGGPWEPIMVWVFPLPVCPYAIIHTLYLQDDYGLNKDLNLSHTQPHASRHTHTPTHTHKRTWAGAHTDAHTQTHTYGNTPHPSSRDVRRGFTSSNTTFWESSGPCTLSRENKRYPETWIYIQKCKDNRQFHFVLYLSNSNTLLMTGLQFTNTVSLINVKWKNN